MNETEQRKGARLTSAYAVRHGYPAPEILLCTDCAEPACEYDHYKGYEPKHWLDIQPVCSACHTRRETKRGAIKKGLARRKAAGLPIGRLPGAKDVKPRSTDGYYARWASERGEQVSEPVKPEPVKNRPAAIRAALAERKAQGLPTGRQAGVKDKRPRFTEGYLERWADRPPKVIKLNPCRQCGLPADSGTYCSTECLRAFWAAKQTTAETE